MTIKLIFTTTIANETTWWLTTGKGSVWRDTLKAAVDSAYQLSGAQEGELLIKQAVAK